MSHRRLGFHYFLRSGILGFFAFYILRLVNQEQLIIYIGPRMQLYVKLSAIGFYLLAVIQIYLAFRTWWGDRGPPEDCGCGNCSPANSSKAGRAFFYGLFIVPLLLFLFLPEAALSSSLVQKKGITLTGSIAKKSAASAPAAGTQPAPRDPGAASDDQEAAAAGGRAEEETLAGLQGADPATLDDAALDSLFPHDEYSEDLAKLAKKLYKREEISIGDEGFMEVVSSIDFYMDRFVGKKVEISGFVYREEDMKENQFVVSRFAVQCCSADAAPFGFMVESAMGKDLQQDTWVRINGTLGTADYNGNEILKIEASKIASIQAPKTPYIFPDFEFFNTDIYD